MKATPQKIDVSSGFKTVTLLVEDFTPFLALGQQVELTVTPITEPAANTATPPPENVVNMTAPETTAAPAETKPVPCTVCHGSGVVAVFDGDQNTGQTAVCSRCSGKGIEPAAS